MRHIYAQAPDAIPRDEEYRFRDRAKALLIKWIAFIPEESVYDASDSYPGSKAYFLKEYVAKVCKLPPKIDISL